MEEKLTSIYEKLTMLNDWHNEVNVWMAKQEIEHEWMRWALKGLMFAFIPILIKTMLD